MTAAGTELGDVHSRRFGETMRVVTLAGVAAGVIVVGLGSRVAVLGLVSLVRDVAALT